MNYQLALKIIFNTIDDLKISKKGIAEKAGISAVHLNKMQNDLGNKNLNSSAGFDVVCKVLHALNIELKATTVVDIAKETQEMSEG